MEKLSKNKDKPYIIISVNLTERQVEWIADHTKNDKISRSKLIRYILDYWQENWDRISPK